LQPISRSIFVSIESQAFCNGIEKKKKKKRTKLTREDLGIFVEAEMERQLCAKFDTFERYH